MKAHEVGCTQWFLGSSPNNSAAKLSIWLSKMLLTDTILTPSKVNTTSLERPSPSKQSRPAARPTNAGPHGTFCLRESQSYQSLDMQPEISLCTCRITHSSQYCCPKTKGCHGPGGRWAELPRSTCGGHLSSVKAQDCPSHATDMPSLCEKELHLDSATPARRFCRMVEQATC